MPVRRVARASVIAAGAAGVVLGAAACSSKPVYYQSPSASSAGASAPAASAPATSAPGASATPAVSESPLPAASGQLTGTQLQTVLLPQSSFPAGYSMSSASAVSSGGSLETAPASYDLGTVSCANFVQHLGDTGFGETAMASNSFASTHATQGFDQVVYQFASASAASGFTSGIQSLAARCGSFTATDNGVSGTFSMKAAAGPAVAGHPSVELRQTGKISGTTVTLDTLFTSSGVDVFGAAGVGLGTAPPTTPATQALVYDLMKRQAAAAELG